jgi:DnaK suppressor protein
MNLAPVMQKENRTRSSEAADRRKASTLDILGRGTTKTRINPAWREHYNRLRELREQMVDSRRTLASDAKEEKANYSIHMADAATDTYDSDWALSMLSSDQNAIYEIEEAINRIEAGVYGTCEMTGKPIEEERLEAIPWTRFSMEAQQQLEDQGAVYKTRLADRRGLTAAEDTAETDEGGEEAG